MRQLLTTGQVIEIKTENATMLSLALVSGEVNYRVGDNAFNDLSDDKLNDDLRTDVVPIGSPTSVFIKAILPSEIQYRRE